jgi:hypothetical protein
MTGSVQKHTAATGFVNILYNDSVQSFILPRNHEQSISENPGMATLHHRRTTFFKAIAVYIDHSLQAATFLLEMARSYENILGQGSNYQSCGASTKYNLEKLVQYLQKTTTSHLSLENVGRRLAIIDRLEKSVEWSRKWKYVIRSSQSVFGEVNVHAYSAKYLKVADEYAMKGDLVLQNEWLLVAELFEACVHAPTLSQYQFSALDGKDDVTGRPHACRMILSLLSAFPELLPKDSRIFLARYQFKQSVAEKEDEQRLKVEQVQTQCAEQTNPHLRRLLQHQCTVHSNMMAELRRMYEHSASETDAYKMLLNHAQSLAVLWTALISMQAAFQTSNLEYAPNSKSTKATLSPRYHALRAEGEKLLDDMSALFANQPVEPSVSFAADMSALQKRAEAITASVKELAKSISANPLAPHVRVKLREALAVRPFTKYHQKIVECLEKAASATTPRESDRFVQLAEGIFASAVTCHTQWERAVGAQGRQAGGLLAARAGAGLGGGLLVLQHLLQCWLRSR